jgi:hypothetical protein
MFGWGKKRGQQSRSGGDDAPEGEAEKVVQVQMICKVASGSAETVAAASDDAEWLAHERERYEKHRAKALELAKTITDQFFRDAAVHNVIDLCMAAGDRDAAKALFGSVRTDMIQEKILEAHPTLR